ncbi:hypothetical protein KP79_PYT08971 [Mizuhopecten yessoensis]|uniref:Uncharacterized protein n=1 Tax=Mizuhopecten yessoensis TaxID=6573 RepID=A0A210PQ65_MIZYE|nr:hypothetical protein KP79_PYT08971 [Mizuhopecten yessoensis]
MSECIDFLFQSTEPAQGYVQQLYSYLSSSEVPKVCPSSQDIVHWICVEYTTTVLYIVAMLILPSVDKKLWKRWPRAMSRLLKLAVLIERISTFSALIRCRHCGTYPCQAEREYSWKPPGSCQRTADNYIRRAVAVIRLQKELVDSGTLPEESIPQNVVYLESIFPLCIQRQLDIWYPLPR